jgi:hypothetical protein
VIAANCFLKYVWWTACYSACYGLPKLPWRAAGVRASFYGWSVIVLDLSSITVLFTVLRSPSSQASGFLKQAPRVMLSLLITIAGTAGFALALSWIKQGMQ